MARFGRSSVYAVHRALERRQEAHEQQEQGGAHLPQPPLPPVPELPEDDPAFQPGEKVRHTFRAARSYCIQILVWACGVPIAVTKFYSSESETQVKEFLESVWPDEDDHLRPDYIAYDRACFILRHLVRHYVASPWVHVTRWIVDAWHYIGHRVDDPICRSRCNPAPTDGSQPDLVVTEIDHTGRRVSKRVFNTEKAEQLNAWVDGYKGALNPMTDYNFDFFIYSLLFLYTEDWKYRKHEAEQCARRGEELRLARLQRQQQGEGEEDQNAAEEDQEEYDNLEDEEQDADGDEHDGEE